MHLCFWVFTPTGLNLFKRNLFNDNKHKNFNFLQRVPFCKEKITYFLKRATTASKISNCFLMHPRAIVAFSLDTANEGKIFL